MSRLILLSVRWWVQAAQAQLYVAWIYCNDLAKQKCWDATFLCSSSSTTLRLSFALYGLVSVFSLLCLCSSLSFPSLWALLLFLPCLAVYKEECHTPIGWLVSLSQLCHYWNPTGLMLIYTHRWAPNSAKNKACNILGLPWADNVLLQAWRAKASYFLGKKVPRSAHFMRLWPQMHSYHSALPSNGSLDNIPKEDSGSHNNAYMSRRDAVLHY